MKTFLFILLFIPLNLIAQSAGFYTYPLQTGKVIIAILKDEQNTRVILNNFYSDFDKIEESTSCELNQSYEFINCKKLTDSTYYWNVSLSYDSSFYVLTGGKSSKLELIDTVIIEKRDLDFNLLSIYKYHLPPLLFSTLLTIKDSIYHIFAVPQLIYNDSLVEFILTSDINFSKTKVISHFLNNNYITYLKPLPELNQYIGWYSGGLAKTDNTFINPQYLDDKKLHIQGSIINAIDSGYVAFGGAKSIIDGTGLAIVKYNPDLHHVKIDEITEDTVSFELPAVSYSLVKNKTNYFISGFLDANKGSLYTSTYNNLIYI